MQNASSPPGSICFDLAPDTSILHDMLYTITFSAPLNIGSAGPHLQIAFTDTVGGGKVGSLYSQDVGSTNTTNTTKYDQHDQHDQHYEHDQHDP